VKRYLVRPSEGKRDALARVLFREHSFTDLIVDEVAEGFVIEADVLDLAYVNEVAWRLIGSVEPYRPTAHEMKIDPTFAKVAHAVERGYTYLAPVEYIEAQAREHGDLAALTIMNADTNGIVPINHAYAPQRNARQDA
jgi:hypothetical protein